MIQWQRTWPPDPEDMMQWQRTLLLKDREFCLAMRAMWGAAYLDSLIEQAKKEEWAQLTFPNF